MQYLSALNAFCLQLNEFCLIFQRAIRQQRGLRLSDPSAARAQAFAETLILCPTTEAVHASIGRDFAGAHSFLIAADGVLRSLRIRPFEFAKDCPACQTKFYLLSCAVDEFLEGNRQPDSGVENAPDPAALSVTHS